MPTPLPPDTSGTGAFDPPAAAGAQTVAAGDLGRWVADMAAVLRGTAGAEVPCGACVGCCSSRWPVALRDGDAAAAAKFPPQSIVAPANAPTGLRYAVPLEDGRCTMLCGKQCSIYPIRPQTCRDFDCRLFAATGIDAAGEDKPLINERIQAWRFSYASPADEERHEALRAAARFLQKALLHPGSPRLPSSPVAIAGLAFKAHPVFLQETSRDMPFEALLQQVLAEIRRFDAPA